MARRAVWTRVMHRSGLERPHFVATGIVAVAPDHTFAVTHAAGEGDRDAANNPEELRASREVPILRPRDLRHLRNRARCGSFHATQRIGSVLLSRM